MIVIDTSGTFAIMYEEAAAMTCKAAMTKGEPLLISAGTLAEAQIVAAGRKRTDKLADFLKTVNLEVVPVTAETAEAVGRAYARWGKGLHPARLNFGDCFAYALAQERNCPLLFVGDDFAKTDVASALG